MIQTNNNIIIMFRLSSSSSYYMGISYRPTNRIHQQMEMSKSTNLDHLCVNSVNLTNEHDQQYAKAIHTQKLKKKAQQIAKHRNPYLSRKQFQFADKNKNSKYHIPSHQHLKQFFKVSKMKTQGDQPSNQSHSKQTKIKYEFNAQINTQKQKYNNIKVQRNIKSGQQNPKNKQSSHINENENSLFHHFPSHLFNDPPKKYSISFSKKNQSFTRKSSFFFPSNKLKTESEKCKSLVRPTSAYPKRKSCQESHLFNFDGTLQNHQIKIPQRPKTADYRKSSKYYSEHAEYLNYKVIASRCIRRKNSKQSDKELKIMPWGSRDSDRAGENLMDLSYSTIRDELNAQT